MGRSPGGSALCPRGKLVTRQAGPGRGPLATAAPEALLLLLTSCPWAAGRGAQATWPSHPCSPVLKAYALRTPGGGRLGRRRPGGRQELAPQSACLAPGRLGNACGPAPLGARSGQHLEERLLSLFMWPRWSLGPGALSASGWAPCHAQAPRSGRQPSGPQPQPRRCLGCQRPRQRLPGAPRRKGLRRLDLGVVSARRTGQESQAYFLGVCLPDPN